MYRRFSFPASAQLKASVVCGRVTTHVQTMRSVCNRWRSTTGRFGAHLHGYVHRMRRSILDGGTGSTCVTAWLPPSRQTRAHGSGCDFPSLHMVNLCWRGAPPALPALPCPLPIWDTGRAVLCWGHSLTARAAIHHSRGRAWRIESDDGTALFLQPDAQTEERGPLSWSRL